MSLLSSLWPALRNGNGEPLIELLGNTLPFERVLQRRTPSHLWSIGRPRIRYPTFQQLPWHPAHGRTAANFTFGFFVGLATSYVLSVLTPALLGLGGAIKETEGNLISNLQIFLLSSKLKVVAQSSWLAGIVIRVVVLYDLMKLTDNL